ncbi:hypothetical protein [Mycobacteroides immunogenum]|uniref:hypothetical protein n=1 Tax=Mycobacteroides immunogenum TaxID=83262 RepID=UPI001F463520|nr:hypothetical protein [Mycobacteroides immunogenum]
MTEDDLLHDEISALYRKVTDGIAEMEIALDAADEFIQTPFDPVTVEPNEPAPPRTLSDLEEDDVYQFKRFGPK